MLDSPIPSFFVSSRTSCLVFRRILDFYINGTPLTVLVDASLFARANPRGTQAVLFGLSTPTGILIGAISEDALGDADLSVAIIKAMVAGAFLCKFCER
jgi:hypothetical protein